MLSLLKAFRLKKKDKGARCALFFAFAQEKARSKSGSYTAEATAKAGSIAGVLRTPTLASAR